MSAPDMGQMVRVFARIGVLSFGGPAAQIALMHNELVDQRGWLDEPTYLRALSLCMLLPGPEAMQLATYAGWRLRGVPGGLVAGGLFVLPGALVITVLVALYAGFGQVPLVQAAFLGIKAAVTVIVIQALRKVAAKALTRPGAWMIAAVAFAGIFALNLPFPLIIAAAGLWGYFSATDTAGLPAPGRVIGTGRTAVIWLTLWLVPLILLSLAGPAFLASIGWFFAQMAVVTFGGAYAVLGYMTQTVVQDFGWVTTAQMIDALGLAETTPGPLILVTQFVAMLAGHQAGGAGLALLAGIVALWATFVPCFLWIFLAGPYLDHIAGRPRLGAALGAITAAVVGVILNLSLWFALHVVFASVRQTRIGPLSLPLPDPATLNLTALMLTAAAALWMLVGKRGMGETLVIMALAGMAFSML